ncbi:OprD family outer membrane porin [Zeaxanthinibacter enoshimensis]|uniref:Outer membrane OprD family porin n=1 Tax=Zeaxanthinibacter enoshimensis TaxID=392009 RepID=A0A4R6TLM2_9FLAO|nr:OprD family outer membrane porin [Zeaxanthinibacter enoshimensis]TDQ32362.1 outer membrane OprD family porin [Zeaxanthinibacter enoshimensis]
MRHLLYLILITPFLVLSQESDSLQNGGKLTGQWRTYYMNTFNKGDLKDFSALATGGKIKYQYNFNSRFALGAALYNSTNLGLQDLTIPDETTGKLSRYEEGLFNRLDLANDAVVVLGELYGTYSTQNHHIRLGRMKIKSPLVNPQDGRMIPTFVQGAWYKYTTGSGNEFQVGVLNQIAPRSTGEFFKIGESIGTYPEGRNDTGLGNQYFNNTDSDYILLLNTNLRLTEKLKVRMWNYFVDNISNSFYMNPSLEFDQNTSMEMEWLHQNRVGDGGNAIDSLRYFDQNSSDLIGIRFNYKWERSSASLSYNRVLPHGQFISPREWGREFLFSFQKRERTEGSADNHALVFYYNTVIPLVQEQAEVSTILSLGRHWKPSVQDPIKNKYAVPDYTHINLDLFFNFKGLKNLKPELLLTAKLANGEFPDNPNFYLNKTDLFHFDLILNYNF